MRTSGNEKSDIRPPVSEIWYLKSDVRPVRLAYLRHAASVHPEPGSNSYIYPAPNGAGFFLPLPDDQYRMSDFGFRISDRPRSDFRRPMSDRCSGIHFSKCSMTVRKSESQTKLFLQPELVLRSPLSSEAPGKRRREDSVLRSSEGAKEDGEGGPNMRPPYTTPSPQSQPPFDNLTDLVL